MFFSVIVPVYNVELYLRECVDSILSQTFTDFELILVDDGSQDKSSAICDEYAQADARVKVIHKENGGQSTARNLGVKSAKGKFVIFLDSDDFIANKSFFQDIYDIANEKTDIVLFRYCKYYGDGHTNDCRISLANLDANNKTNLIQELVARDAFFCSCWSKCTRLELLKNNGIEFDTNLCCEDMDWYYQVISAAKRLKVLDKPYIYYRQRDNSVTSTFKEKSFTDYIFTIKKWSNIWGNVEDEEEKRIMLSSLAKLYCNLLISYSRHRKKLKSHKKEIFSFKRLLTYDLNPRTKKMNQFTKFFGLNITCSLLNMVQKVR